MDEPIDPAFLRDSELFENQSAEVIRAVLSQGQLLEFGPGQVVFRQGDEGDRLFVVKSGVLEVVAAPSDGSEPTVVAYLGTGEVIGELALLTGSPRSATVRSPEHAVLFAVEKAVFLDLGADGRERPRWQWRRDSRERRHAIGSRSSQREGPRRKAGALRS